VLAEPLALRRARLLVLLLAQLRVLRRVRVLGQLVRV
jgi:hypothetical protein